MLEQLRNEIDSIDKQLVSLLEQRLDVSKKVGAYKRDHHMEIFVPEREKEVIERRTEQTKNPLYRTYIAELFEGIMQVSRRLQSTILKDKKTEDIYSSAVPFENENVKVVYPGTAGSYSGEALKQCFPQAKEVIHAETFTEAAQMVARGEADFGVLPFENNSSGAISDTLDLILSEKLYIVGETYVDIRHCLMGTADATLENIKEIYSHQQGFAQSKTFLEHIKAQVTCIPMENTAFAAKYVAECGNKQKAAIASRLAAETYGLKILQEDIHENHGNTTRFVVISNRLTVSETSDKISAAFVARHKSGALCDALALFANNGINLLHIESRPLKEKDFSYMFHIDFEGNIASPNVQHVISQMQESGAEFYVLGNYTSQKK